jgi:hypothetical protein
MRPLRIGSVSTPSTPIIIASGYIRSKQLVALLVDHIPDRYNYFVYFGSRSSQTARARAFIDLAVKRLVDNTEYVLSSKELRMESRRGRVSMITQTGPGVITQN